MTGIFLQEFCGIVSLTLYCLSWLMSEFPICSDICWASLWALCSKMFNCEILGSSQLAELTKSSVANNQKSICIRRKKKSHLIINILLQDLHSSLGAADILQCFYYNFLLNRNLKGQRNTFFSVLLEKHKLLLRGVTYLHHQLGSLSSCDPMQKWRTGGERSIPWYFSKTSKHYAGARLPMVNIYPNSVLILSCISKYTFLDFIQALDY